HLPLPYYMTCILFFLLLLPSPSIPPSFPYTTLFRSLCHPLLVGAVLVNFRIEDDYIEVEAHVDTVDRTGVEMEALTACSVACLTDRKSTRLNSSHVAISYAVFCLKKKKHTYVPSAST